MPMRDSEQNIVRNTRDIVVVGASAGGVEALTALVGNLPRDLPAAIFVVLHIPAEVPSMLAHILSRAGSLPATAARDKAPIECGHIYVAPPDNHLLLTHDEMRIIHGPRENRNRPAVDPLFRTAALAFGSRVIGIVLSGALDDGTSGLLAIKRAGGIALVQDPSTAAFAGMPESALSYVSVDWCLPIPALAAKLVSLVTASELPLREGAVPMSKEMDAEQQAALQREANVAGLNPVAASHEPHNGRLSGYTCPDCHGPLWEIQDGQLLRFRCRVGHAFTAETMIEGQADNVEEALWMAVNQLQENAQLYERLANQAQERNHKRMVEQFTRKALASGKRAAVIRRLVEPAPESAGQPAPSPIGNEKHESASEVAGG